MKYILRDSLIPKNQLPHVTYHTPTTSSEQQPFSQSKIFHIKASTISGINVNIENEANAISTQTQGGP